MNGGGGEENTCVLNPHEVERLVLKLAAERPQAKFPVGLEDPEKRSKAAERKRNNRDLPATAAATRELQLATATAYFERKLALAEKNATATAAAATRPPTTVVETGASGGGGGGGVGTSVDDGEGGEGANWADLRADSEEQCGPVAAAVAADPAVMCALAASVADDLVAEFYSQSL
jgi:hypothetical protein